MIVFHQHLEKVKIKVKEVPVSLAFHRAEDSILIDIREESEIVEGMPVDAIHIPRAFLEMQVEKKAKSLDQQIFVICASGVRSALATSALLDLGFRNVLSVQGGYNAWNAAGLPSLKPKVLSASEKKRFSRHFRIPEVQESGQLKLKSTSVLVIGSGGLGCPSLLYLAAAGIGRLTIVDNDVVDESNLQRQVLYTEEDVGKNKVDAARARLHKLNKNVQIEILNLRIDDQNIEDLVQSHDIILDGTDNFETRYFVSDACVKFNKPLVHGSVFRFDGQVSVFWPNGKFGKQPCYRCVYPEAPPADLAPSCMDAGVLGVLPGVVGLMQAVEVLKLALGIGSPLVGKLLNYDALTASTKELELLPEPGCSCHH